MNPNVHHDARQEVSPLSSGPAGAHVSDDLAVYDRSGCTVRPAGAQSVTWRARRSKVVGRQVRPDEPALVVVTSDGGGSAMLEVLS